MHDHSDSRLAQAPQSRQGQRDVQRVTWIGLIINVALSAFKFAVGIAGHSQAVVADAVHSLSDTVTDVAVLVGVRYWNAPADACHPYGHRRIETIVTLGIGAALVGVAAGLVHDAIGALRGGEFKQPGWIAFAGAAISIVVKEILYRWTLGVGRRLRSSALVANAWHHRSDAISSIPAALAVVAGALRPDWAVLDKVGALVVTALILQAAYRILKPAVVELSDRGVPEQMRRRIGEIGARTPEVGSIHAIRTRRMGSGILVDLHATVDGRMTVAHGHDLSEEVRRRILREESDVLDVVVHLEPDDHAQPD